MIRGLIECYRWADGCINQSLPWQEPIKSHTQRVSDNSRQTRDNIFVSSHFAGEFFEIKWQWFQFCSPAVRVSGGIGIKNKRLVMTDGICKIYIRISCVFILTLTLTTLRAILHFKHFGFEVSLVYCYMQSTHRGKWCNSTWSKVFHLWDQHGVVTNLLHITGSGKCNTHASEYMCLIW